MMRPLRCLIIGRSTACVQVNAPVRLTASTWSHSLALHPHQQLVARDPRIVHEDVDRARAPSTRPCTRPSTAGWSVTSTAAASAAPPAAAISAATPAACVAQHVGHDDDGAAPAELQRDRPANAARRARDNGHPSVQSHLASSRSDRPAASGALGGEERRHRVEPCGVVDARGRGLAVDLPAEARQDRPRSHFNIRTDALRRKPPDDVLPPDRRRHLPHERLDRRRGRRVSARRRRWPPPGRAGPTTASARSSGASRSSAGFINAQWNGALTGSGTTRFAPAALHRSPARATAAGRSRDDDLAGCVQVGRADDLALGRLVARPRHGRRHRGRGRRPWRPARPVPPPACSGRGGGRCARHRRSRSCRPPRAPSTRRGCGRRRSRA